MGIHEAHWLSLKRFITLSAGMVSISAHAVVFQAEDYSDHYDTTPGNTGGAYRADNVDIETTSDSGGGFNVGWIENGEWLAFQNLNIPDTGTYTVHLRVASQGGGGIASIDLNAGTTVLGEVAIPDTGGWQSWRTLSFNTTITQGNHSLGVFAKNGHWNLNWIEIVPSGGSNDGQVTLFEHCNYAGWSGKLPTGSHSTASLYERNIANNQVSSITIEPGFEAQLFDGDNFTGQSITLRGNDHCLVDHGFNDRTSSVIVRPDSGGQQLVWADEFNSIDPTTWTFETGGGGWGNNEFQYYTGGQNASIQYDASIGSNVLVIEARRENPANYQCWYGRCDYTSTRLISRDKKSFQYGRIEARIKLPHTQGIWPAFWMLGDAFGSQGWPEGGEIDIMEHVGFEPTLTHGALHGPGYSGNTPISGTHNLGEIANANYHVFAVEWDANQIQWFVDGTNFYTATRAQVEQYGRWVYDQPFWVLFNIAVGGTWPGSPDGSSQFPQRMYIDYLRVYQ